MPFYFENLAYFVPSTETKKINGFAPIPPRLVGAVHILRHTLHGLKFLASHFFSSEPS